MLGNAAVDFFGQRLQVFKKGLDEIVNFTTGGRERKRPAVKQRRAQKFLELGHLEADRRLLDAVGDVMNRFRDAAMPGHVIEQFQVVDVHRMQ